ncbi:hypothetical protein BH18THE2_BH18THE2_11560 [soil metagenome]
MEDDSKCGLDIETFRIVSELRRHFQQLDLSEEGNLKQQPSGL